MDLVDMMISKAYWNFYDPDLVRSVFYVDGSGAFSWLSLLC